MSINSTEPSRATCDQVVVLVVAGIMKRQIDDTSRPPVIKWSDLVHPITMIYDLFFVINICVLVMQPMTTEARDPWVESLLVAGGARSLKSLPGMAASIIRKFSYMMSEQGFNGLDFPGRFPPQNICCELCVYQILVFQHGVSLLVLRCWCAVIN